MSLVEKALRKLQNGTPPRAPARPESPSKAGDTGAKDADTRHAAPAAQVVRPERVVTINATALRGAGLMPPADKERQLAQQYRQIKRPLIGSAIGRGAPRLPSGHIIMVASAVPGEGKTFTAINLALSMSIEKDIRVLLVDADVAKRHISRLLAIGDVPGLMDVLRDPKMDVESVILPTDVPNLTILAAGTASDQATELLSSARMEETVRAIGEHDHHRVVLFDSPPLLHTTESHALMQVAGQVVVVVRAGTTSQQVLLDALSYLGEHPAVSLILNQSTQSSPDAYYRYGYGEGWPEQSHK